MRGKLSAPLTAWNVKQLSGADQNGRMLVGKVFQGFQRPVGPVTSLSSSLPPKRGWYWMYEANSNTSAFPICSRSQGCLDPR